MKSKILSIASSLVLNLAHVTQAAMIVKDSHQKTLNDLAFERDQLQARSARTKKEMRAQLTNDYTKYKEQLSQLQKESTFEQVKKFAQKVDDLASFANKNNLINKNRDKKGLQVYIKDLVAQTQKLLKDKTPSTWSLIKTHVTTTAQAAKNRTSTLTANVTTQASGIWQGIKNWLSPQQPSHNKPMNNKPKVETREKLSDLSPMIPLGLRPIPAVIPSSLRQDYGGQATRPKQSRDDRGSQQNPTPSIVSAAPPQANPAVALPLDVPAQIKENAASIVVSLPAQSKEAAASAPANLVVSSPLDVSAQAKQLAQQNPTPVAKSQAQEPQIATPASAAVVQPVITPANKQQEPRAFSLKLSTEYLKLIPGANLKHFENLTLEKVRAMLIAQSNQYTISKWLFGDYHRLTTEKALYDFIININIDGKTLELPHDLVRQCVASAIEQAIAFIAAESSSLPSTMSPQPDTTSPSTVTLYAASPWQKITNYLNRYTIIPAAIILACCYAVKNNWKKLV